MRTPSSRLRLGVRGKLVAVLVGSAFLALLLACGAFVYYDRVTYAASKRSTLSVLTDSVAQSAFGPTAFQDQDSAKTILQVLDAEPTARAGAIYAKTGERLAAWSRVAGEGPFPAARDEASARPPAAQTLALRRAITKDADTAGELFVDYSTADVDARTRSFLQIAFGVLAVAVLLAAALGTLAQRVFTRPVAILAHAARCVQEEKNFDVRAERVSDDELGALTDAFNAMLAMIRDRDRELEGHRVHLEDLVAERTRDLDQRNREMRLVLDNVDQGFVTLDRAGAMGAERSRAFDAWFGTPSTDAAFGSHLSKKAPSFGPLFDVCWEQLHDGLLGLDVCLGQFPSAIATEDGRHYELGLRPIGSSEGEFEKLLAVVTDVTLRIEKERGDAERQQLVAALEQISADHGGFAEFVADAERLVASVSRPDAPRGAEMLRDLHTLKGNFGVFGLGALASLVHDAETRTLESDGVLSPADAGELAQAWGRFAEKVRGFLGDGPKPVTLDAHELAAFLEAIEGDTPRDELHRLASRFAHDPVPPRLTRLAERARRLSDRLGKGEVSVNVDSDGVRAGAEHAWLWPHLAHVVANCVDHGLHTVGERAALGLQGPPEVTLRAREEQRGLIVEIRDNGRGVDWERIRQKALAAGLPTSTPADLERALFADGISSRDEASLVSGRGVGLAAVAGACTAHGATLRVRSEPGGGTVFTFLLASPDTPERLAQAA